MAVNLPHQPPNEDPPGWATRFLEWYCHEDLLEEIQGDLIESYNLNLKRYGRSRARLLFCLYVCLFFRPSTIKNIHPQHSGIMWKNYAKVAVRNVLRHKGYALLNVFGLTLGLVTCFLIALWVQDELSVNRYHEEGDRLYQMYRNFHFNGQVGTTASVPKPLESVLEDRFPDVEYADMFSWENEFVIRNGEKILREKGRFLGDTYFLQFDHPFLAGDPATALDEVGEIVLSERLADRLLGEGWNEAGLVPGAIIQVEIDSLVNVQVSGVYQDIPDNSSFIFDFALSEELYNQNNAWVDNWRNNGYRMFVKLRTGANLEGVNPTIQNLIRENAPEEAADLFLKPYEDIYLYGEYKEGQLAGGRIEYVRIFSWVGLFIFLIACINFMNLATARSSLRAREIGIRKTVGALKKQLISQFMVEAVLLAFVSLLLSALVLVISLPFFNTLTGKSLYIEWANPLYWVLALVLTLLMGLLAGSYPSFILSSIRVTEVLKGFLFPHASTASIRKGMVVFQFVMSNILIITTFATYQQIQYIKNKNLGYNKENIVYFPIEGSLIQKYELFKNQILEHPAVLNVSGGGEDPTAIGRSTGGLQWPGKDPEFKSDISVIVADYEYVETFGMEVLSGRSHQENFSLDSANLLVNEAAARLMELEHPVGTEVSMWGREGKIVGLLKDFHFNSLYQSIDPLVIRLDPNEVWTYFVKLSGSDIQSGLSHIEQTYKTLNPGFPFTYEFLDDTYAQSFKSETIIGRLAGLFSLMAIAISCLGLFGLATFASARRNKEMGIRKIMGAPVSRLVLLLNKDFLQLTFWAFVVAVPIAWLLISNWLNKFAYHAQIGWEIYVLSGLLSLLIASLTVSIKSLQAALANPVESLRVE